MAGSSARVMRVLHARPRISGLRVGTVLEVRENGEVLVDFADNPHPPARARIAGALSAERVRAAAGHSAAVVLAFEADDPRMPIVLDTVRETVDAASEGERASAEPARPEGPRWEAPPSSHTATTVTCLARIVRVVEGLLEVEVEGEPGRSHQAACAVTLQNLEDPVVLLQLADRRWIVVGQVQRAPRLEPGDSPNADLFLRGRSVHLEAAHEIILVAGSSRLHLDARGRTTLSGDQVVSRASGVNRVQGGSVQLN